MENGSVSPLILIELTAQTAGIATGWEESVIKGKKIDGQLGWLVGIKQADFHINEIAVGTLHHGSYKKNPSVFKPIRK